jgi:lipocalin
MHVLNLLLANRNSWLLVAMPLGLSVHLITRYITVNESSRSRMLPATDEFIYTESDA